MISFSILIFPLVCTFNPVSLALAAQSFLSKPARCLRTPREATQDGDISGRLPPHRLDSPMTRWQYSARGRYGSRDGKTLDSSHRVSCSQAKHNSRTHWDADDARGGYEQSVLEKLPCLGPSHHLPFSHTHPNSFWIG